MSELRTALEIALAEPDARRREASKNIIPPMVHPLGQHWDQPKPERIQIDDTHAMMDGTTFDALANYSASQPTGCYPGKMWKANFKLDGWFLCWFGYSDKGPEWCSTFHRKIIVV